MQPLMIREIELALDAIESTMSPTQIETELYAACELLKKYSYADALLALAITERARKIKNG